MNIRSIVAACALALASQAGMAQVALNFGNTTGTIGFSATPSPGPFVASYTFTLANAGTLSASITSVVNGAQDLDITAITLVTPNGGASFGRILDDPFETWGLYPIDMVAGAYWLTIQGVNSASPASFGGNLAVTLVPEPEPLALLLAGLAVVGLLARLRVHEDCPSDGAEATRENRGAAWCYRDTHGLPYARTR